MSSQFLTYDNDCTKRIKNIIQLAPGMDHPCAGAIRVDLGVPGASRYLFASSAAIDKNLQSSGIDRDDYCAVVRHGRSSAADDHAPTERASHRGGTPQSYTDLPCIRACFRGR